jgi:Arc/MetJ family transcription regulator
MHIIALAACVYSGTMRKHTTIDLDTDLVAAAADVLGTRRTVDTVHAALQEVVAVRRRLRLLDFQPELSLSDLAASRQGRFVERRIGDGHRGA